MSTPISKNNFLKTARESRVECKWEYQNKIKNKKNKKCTWQNPGYNLPFPALVHLSTLLNQRIPSNPPMRASSPFFYASLPDNPPMPPTFFLFLFHLYLYQPLKPNMLKKIHFPFFYFLSFFENQNAPLRSLIFICMQPH